jgi:protein ImuB
MRYTQGLALATDLRAGEVSDERIAEGVTQITAHLQQWTPGVEPCSDEPGVFWLNAAGLETLYPSLDRWAQGVRQSLRRAGFVASVVVGFSRFNSFAVARSRRETLVFPDADREQAVALAVPLDRLVLAPRVRDTLHKLGVHTVGQLVALPAEGVLKRFGEEAHRIHAQAAGALRQPLQAAPIVEPICEHIVLDFAVRDAHRLLFLIKSRLPALMRALANRTLALTDLLIHLRLEDGGECRDCLKPAAPTLDQVQIVDLVRLWLERVQPAAGATEIHLQVEGVCAETEQLRLFALKPRRDIGAANRALARIRAELGEQAVVRAQIRDAHLPEARFVWERFERLPLPQTQPTTQARRLVRRIYSQPWPLPAVPRHIRDEGWQLGPQLGAVVRLLGPYMLSGGWALRERIRAYHFAETQRGDLLWLFHDRQRRRWFCHGRVE